MPFRNCFARTFKSAAVLREAPPRSGIYGLSNALGWIYVGETDNIQAQLLAHLEEPRSLVGYGVPTGFSFPAMADRDRYGRSLDGYLLCPMANDTFAL